MIGGTLRCMLSLSQLSSNSSQALFGVSWLMSQKPVLILVFIHILVNREKAQTLYMITKHGHKVLSPELFRKFFSVLSEL